jgi:Tol biopolymer transport system component
MIEERDLLADAAGAIEPPRDVMDGLVRRRDRKRRNRRVGSALVAIVTMAAVAVALGEVVGSRGTEPAHRPTPSHTLNDATIGPVVVGLDGTVLAQVPGLPFGKEYLTLSPDGRTIAFSANHAGGISIATAGLDGSHLRWLTDVWGAEMPSWSPDGSRIAFAAESSNRPGHVPWHIYLMNADGSDLRELTHGPGFDEWPTWAPDGSTIAYSEVATFPRIGPGPLDTNRGSSAREIWTVPADGGAPTRLTENAVWDDMPAYSPDGTRIAVARDGAIWVMDADGSDARPLAGQPADSRFFNPTWSPDGTKIAFTSYEGERSEGVPLLAVHLVDLSTGAFTVIRGTVAGGGVPGAVSWLPTSDALLMNRYWA